MAQRGRPRLTEFQKAQRAYEKQYLRLEKRVANIEKRGIKVPSLFKAHKLLKEAYERPLKAKDQLKSYQYQAQRIESFISTTPEISVSGAYKWKRMKNDILKERIKKEPRLKEELKYREKTSLDIDNMLSKAFELYKLKRDRDFKYKVIKYTQVLEEKYGGNTDIIFDKLMKFVDSYGKKDTEYIEQVDLEINNYDKSHKRR